MEKYICFLFTYSIGLYKIDLTSMRTGSCKHLFYQVGLCMYYLSFLHFPNHQLHLNCNSHLLIDKAL